MKRIKPKVLVFSTVFTTGILLSQILTVPSAQADWSDLDPTNRNGALREGLRNLDPTNPDSATSQTVGTSDEVLRGVTDVFVENHTNRYINVKFHVYGTNNPNCSDVQSVGMGGGGCTYSYDRYVLIPPGGRVFAIDNLGGFHETGEVDYEGVSCSAFK